MYENKFNLPIWLLAKVDIWTSSCISVFFMPHSILSMFFLPIITASERSQCMRHNIYGPWIVDGVDFNSCFILNYMNITSTLYHFTIDLCRFLKSLSSGNTLSVLLVSVVLLNISQPTTHVVEDEQKKFGYYDIIYWYEQHQILYPSSHLFMYFFTHEGSSSIISQNICFSAPVGFWMTGPECLHCAGIYTFVQRTICFK